MKIMNTIFFYCKMKLSEGVFLPGKEEVFWFWGPMESTVWEASLPSPAPLTKESLVGQWQACHGAEVRPGEIPQLSGQFPQSLYILTATGVPR